MRKKFLKKLVLMGLKEIRFGRFRFRSGGMIKYLYLKAIYYSMRDMVKYMLRIKQELVLINKQSVLLLTKAIIQFLIHFH
jgi:hypothetical protein